MAVTASDFIKKTGKSKTGKTKLQPKKHASDALIAWIGQRRGKAGKGANRGKK